VDGAEYRSSLRLDGFRHLDAAELRGFCGHEFFEVTIMVAVREEAQGDFLRHPAGIVDEEAGKVGFATGAAREAKVVADGGSAHNGLLIKLN
jgi:hypothetical protein